MLKEERLNNILQTIKSKGSVSIDLLCRMYEVTEMTARRDLDELAEKGLIKRIHGGATVSDVNILTESPFELRLSKNIECKQAISELALKYINDGQKIYLDSGTTTDILAKKIDSSKNLVVVTNAINIASELNPRLKITVITVGGELRKTTFACTGYYAEDMIKQFKTDLAFIGVSGIGYSGELYVFNVVELGIKKAIMQSAKNVIVLCDSSKIGTEEFVSFSTLKEVKTLITDDKIPDFLLKSYKDMNVDVKVAKISKSANQKTV